MSARATSSFSLGEVPRLDRDEPKFLEIYDKLIAATKKRGQYAGIHCASTVYAAKAIKQGFRLVTIMNDSGLMLVAARDAVRQVREGAGEVAAA